MSTPAAPRARRGRFIVLEGIDGAGKSEQARRLATWLRERGEQVVETKEPTDGEWGRCYRAWARGETRAKPDEVMRFFLEDRREHVEKTIRPALEDGCVVVCDRYVASTLAYQAAHGVDRETLRAKLQAEHFPEPDAVLWLRLPVAQALGRLGRKATERFEREPFLERVDREYADLGLEEIDASGPPEQVERSVRNAVARLLAQP